MPESQHKILLVEDAVPLATAIRDSLLAEGFAVLVAGDGEMGLAMALDEKPDLILLDITLPKKSGLVMLKELRATKQGEKVPVMMLTNSSETNDVNEALKNGAYDYMVKADWKIADIIQNVRTKLHVNHQADPQQTI